jgi:translation elongation factor EF-G
MNNFEEKLNNRENKKEQEIINLVKTLEKIKKTDIFEPGYIGMLKFISFGKKQKMLFENASLKEIVNDDFNVQDFMQGKRTDFVGIQPRVEFLEYDLEKLDDKQILPLLFFRGKLTYEEFVAHEIAHNLFDREYKEKIGEWENIHGITDVSQKYRQCIIKQIKKLCKKYYPDLEVEKFNFNRQQIAEVFAMLYQREFCKRTGLNIQVHENVFQNVNKFLKNPQELLDEFNSQYKRQCSEEDFYKENHILSILVAPILEKEFPGFKQRLELFWKQK